MSDAVKSLSSELNRLDVREGEHRGRGVMASAPASEVTASKTERRLDSLAKFLTANNICTAISFFNNQFYLSNNKSNKELFKVFKIFLDGKTVVTQKDVLDFFLDSINYKESKIGQYAYIKDLRNKKDKLKINLKKIILLDDAPTDIKLAKEFLIDNNSNLIRDKSNYKKTLKASKILYNYLKSNAEPLKELNTAYNIQIDSLISTLKQISYPLKLCKKVHQILTSTEFNTTDLNPGNLDGIIGSAIRNIEFTEKLITPIPHAEMNILDQINKIMIKISPDMSKKLNDCYIAITKLCCASCWKTLKIVNKYGFVATKDSDNNHVIIFKARSYHNKVYKLWNPPKFLNDNKYLYKKLVKLLKKLSATHIAAHEEIYSDSSVGSDTDDIADGLSSIPISAVVSIGLTREAPAASASAVARIEDGGVTSRSAATFHVDLDDCSVNAVGRQAALEDSSDV